MRHTTLKLFTVFIMMTGQVYCRHLRASDNALTGQKSTTVTLFGIQLQPPAAILFREVEAQYGTPIIQIPFDGSQVGHFGESGVDDNGNPFIRFDKTHDSREETVVHELFHLKLLAKRFPEIICLKKEPADSHLKLPENICNMMIANVFDALQHAVFYPEMTKMGYNPNWDVYRYWDPKLDGVYSEAYPEGETNLYFWAVIQMNDEKYLKRIEQSLLRNHQTAALELGKAVVSQYRSSTPIDSENIIDVGIRCANTLFKVGYKVELVSMDWVQKGNVRVRRATITVTRI